MKDQLPAPDFNSNRYERPNQKWVCGWLCEGSPCKFGPDGKGKCGATADCTPVLKPGNEGEKPSFVCTRSKELGGPCEEGPRADGCCSHPPKVCQPQLSLRHKRGLLTKSVIVLTIGLLLVMLYGSYRWRFISPGELSFKHRSAAFTKMAHDLHGANQECAACHKAAKSGPSGWIETASAADPGPHEFQKLLLTPHPETTKLDMNCQKCHPNHTFHEPNVAWEYSCSSCHVEHKGSMSMKAVNVQHCVGCHGNEEVMQAAARKGELIPAHHFDFQFDPTRASFRAPRPTNGYTKVITEFSKDHPEFLVHREKMKDPNTLRFSHATHVGMSPNVPLLNGKKLECISCHKPGPGGVYYENVTFEANCRSCHSLQFDRENPGLTIPHGEPAFAQAFLRSLPQQYANYANKSKGLTGKAEVEQFVRERLKDMRDQFGSGEELEQKIFFSDERTAPSTAIGGLGSKGRSMFPGCAYCHEVKPGKDLPVVTAPVMPERWLDRGRFDHSKHANVSCVTCHQQASFSQKASDINLPSKHMCATCHRPQGAARNDCLECHGYHNRPEKFDLPIRNERNTNFLKTAASGAE